MTLRPAPWCADQEKCLVSLGGEAEKRVGDPGGDDGKSPRQTRTPQAGAGGGVREWIV